MECATDPELKTEEAKDNNELQQKCLTFSSESSKLTVSKNNTKYLKIIEKEQGSPNCLPKPSEE